MSSQLEAERAKAALEGNDFKGLNLKVQSAKPPKKQSSRRGLGDSETQILGKALKNG